MLGWILRAFAIGVLYVVIVGIEALLGGRLPWWGSLAAAVAAYLAAAFAVKALFFKALTMPFKAKGAPLRGARLFVHSITAIAKPVAVRQPALALAGGGGGDCEDDDACGDACDAPPDDWRWYQMDATVTPPALNGGPFRGWCPSDLRIVDRNADTSPMGSSDDDRATIQDIQMLTDGAFVSVEDMTLEGEQRLRFTMAFDPALTVAKLRYYFEDFGSIELPRD